MSLREGIRRHPVIASVIVVGTVLGATLGFAFLDPSWSATRRIAAGGVAGGGIGFLMTGTKML